jgi:hypothetical protein
MSSAVTRMFTYFTLGLYLLLGAVTMRVLIPSVSSIEVPISSLSYFSPSKFHPANINQLPTPVIEFAAIDFPKVGKPNKKKILKISKNLATEKVSKYELNFDELVRLGALYAEKKLPSNLVAFYKEFKPERAAKVEPLRDVVSTAMASSNNPDFFEYPKSTEPPTKKIKNSNKLDEDQAFKDQKVIVENKEEEIAVSDLITFDYSKAETDVIAKKMPTITSVDNQKIVPSVNQPNFTIVNKLISSNKLNSQKQNNFENTQASKSSVQETNKSYSSRLTIQVTGTDLKKIESAVGFELRAQDDLGEVFSDYNNGMIVMDQEIAQSKMTRSVTVLKRGFIPTNTELILEDGVSEVNLPLIAENRYNELLAPYESRGTIGSVLVELEEEVVSATLDVPYSQVLQLDENMQVTKDQSFTYQLFLGVKAGNALLSYKSENGESTSKIIHIQDHELTFDANFFETVKDEKIGLFEEHLLSKENTPLIISSEQVRQFASEITAKKINNNTYKTYFNKTLLGARKYLELTHQNEPVYVGYKEADKLEIPSESFMRYILSRFEGSKLGNRCLIQVNLKNKVSRVDVSSESVGQSLETYTQMLDADGKFYDSVGEKTEKIIVVGEDNGSSESTNDGRINFKITYQNGSMQFLGTYCSPNTYLVEQL